MREARSQGAEWHNVTSSVNPLIAQQRGDIIMPAYFIKSIASIQESTRLQLSSSQRLHTFTPAVRWVRNMLSAR